MSQISVFFKPLQDAYFAIRAWQKHLPLLERFLLSPVKAFVFISTNLTFEMYVTWVQIHFGPLIQHVSKSVMIRRQTRIVSCLTFLECYLALQQLNFPLGCWDQWLSGTFLLLLKTQSNFLISLMDKKNLKLYFNAPDMFRNQKTNNNMSKVSLPPSPQTPILLNQFYNFWRPAHAS